MSTPSPLAYGLLALVPVLTLISCMAGRPAAPCPVPSPAGPSPASDAPNDFDPKPAAAPGAPAASIGARATAQAEETAGTTPLAGVERSAFDSALLAATDLAAFLGTDSPAFRFEFDDTSPELRPTPNPDEPISPDVWSRLRLPLGEFMTVRPIGASRLMPGAMMAGPRDQVGPGAGIGLQMQPSEHWRLGMDLLIRAERLDPDHLPVDWAGYIVPGIEYTPTPQAVTPMYIGIVAPMSIGAGENRQGVFFFIRWEEIFGRSHRHR